MSDYSVSYQTVSRIPSYLSFLINQAADCEFVSSKYIADALGLNEVQVRKDLAAVSGAGRPKIGYNRQKLMSDMEEFLGCKTESRAVIVGVGKLATALLCYNGFQRYGLEIVAGFEVNEARVGTQINGRPVYHIDELEAFCRRENIKLGIITVPVSQAQNVCDTLTKSGILAIWNFAPTHLNVPQDVLIHSENMAVSLAVLSRHLNENLGR